MSFEQPNPTDNAGGQHAAADCLDRPNITGADIKRWRMRKGVSADVLGALVSLSPSAIYLYEHGKRQIPWDCALLLEQVMAERSDDEDRLLDRVAQAIGVGSEVLTRHQQLAIRIVLREAAACGVRGSLLGNTPGH